MIFIRPWFLLFLLVPVALWLFKRKWAPSAALSKYVDARLLPFVIVRFGSDTQNKRSWLWLAVWIALCLAGAGPAYEKVSVPTKLSAPAHVIVMDMSPAMSGGMLETAKRKLYDLLSALKGHQAALVVYDEKGYVVSPLTQDLNIIRTMIPGLGENVMPTYGNRADLGFEKADELFKNVGVKNGQIIFLTAGGYDADKLAKTAQKMPYQIATIGFGSNDKAPISLPGGGFLRATDGSVAFADLNENALKKMGTYTKATVTDEDIHSVLSNFADKDIQNGQSDSSNADVWRDLGPVLLILTAPFFAFLFRRGVIYVFVFALFSGLFEGVPRAQAREWFLRPDQQEYKILKQGVDAYRKGDFETAKNAFESQPQTPDFIADALYNKGNALAHLNDIQGAIAAYDAALKINPNHTAAKFNKDYLQQQLPPPQQQKQNSSGESRDGKNQDNQDQNGDSNKSDKSDADTQGQSSNADSSQGENGAERNEVQNAQPNETQDALQNETRQESAQNGQQNVGVKEEPMANGQNDSNSNGQNSQMANAPQDSKNADAKLLTTMDENLPHQSDMDSSVQNPQSVAEQQNMQQPAPEMSSHEAEQSLPAFTESDQEAAQLLNRIRQDPSRLLRYRLYQQWRQQNE